MKGAMHDESVRTSVAYVGTLQTHIFAALAAATSILLYPVPASIINLTPISFSVRIAFDGRGASLFTTTSWFCAAAASSACTVVAVDSSVVTAAPAAAIMREKSILPSKLRRAAFKSTTRSFGVCDAIADNG